MLKFALSAALLVAAPSALAQDRLSDVRVSYGDLDLSNPMDIRTFDHRLTLAVNAVCPSKYGVRELSELHAIDLCRTAKRAEIAPLRQRALAAAAQGAETRAVR